MIDTGCWGWRGGVVLGMLLACESTRVPSSESSSSEVVLPASDEPSAAGAAAIDPASGGAPAELKGGLGGDTSKPAGWGASGMGGNDTGSGGGAGNGASGGNSGASGRDADPSSGDERRYALWLGPAAPTPNE